MVLPLHRMYKITNVHKASQTHLHKSSLELGPRIFQIPMERASGEAGARGRRSIASDTNDLRPTRARSTPYLVLRILGYVGELFKHGLSTSLLVE